MTSLPKRKIVNMLVSGAKSINPRWQWTIDVGKVENATSPHREHSQ